MFTGHLDEFIILMVIILLIVGSVAALVWFFGVAVGRGRAGKSRDRGARPRIRFRN